jgi:tRNA pseudouridine55 synthase
MRPAATSLATIKTVNSDPAFMRAGRRIDGILLLDKPSGPSSNQALQRVKRLFGAHKAGHVGTLDPLASGLLPIVFGEATKFASYASDASKKYEATVLLGMRTTTGDLAGEIIEQCPVAISIDALESALEAFRGAISQVPPMYSALKKQGEPLYRIARRGEVVPRQPRSVWVESLLLRGIRAPEFDIAVECSKGTYIRVLAEDLGAALGCGGVLKSLRRTGVGCFRLDGALELDALEQMPLEARLAAILPMDSGLQDVPSIELQEIQAKRIRQGQPVELGFVSLPEGVVRVYGEGSGPFIGLAEYRLGTLHALRLVSNPGQPESATQMT